MAFTEDRLIDQITVTENGHVLYREANRVYRDGKIIAQTFHRSALRPGQDLTGVPENVAAVARAAWTQKVLAAYAAMTAAQEAKLGGPA